MTRSLVRLIVRALLVAAAALGAPLGALANCARGIAVPVAPIGQSVVIEGGHIQGIYPDLLRKLGDAEGCNFAFSSVPRARLKVLFETGRADLLIPATKTPERDAHGIFVPLIHNRPLLISLASQRAAIASIKELLTQSTLRVALVRGYDYGLAYQEMAKTLEKQGRLTLEVDALSVARLLKAGTVDATVMGSTILGGAMMDDERVRDLGKQLRFESLHELPWGSSGAYISNRSLDPPDAAQLLGMLERAGRSGAVWKAFQQVYPAHLLQDSIRPLGAL